MTAAGKAPRARSFDVFDTCLVRTFATGRDLLAEVARRVVPPGPHAEERAAEVLRLRLEGEVRGARHGADACGLEDVYGAVPELAALGVDVEAMLALELQLERESLRVVAPVRDEVARARAAGERVLFLSDMHLSADFLRESLEVHGVARPADAVYVSGEQGLSKRTGRLYDHVLAQEGLAPGEVQHRGDDVDTDVVQARLRGLLVDEFVEGRLNRYETAVLHDVRTPREVRNRLAAVSRVARLGEPGRTRPQRLGAALGADVVGPLLAGYVAWVLADARAQGVATLCFVSRDGQVLHEIAQRLRRPDDPRCVYLYGSRQAWFLPGSRPAETDALDWVYQPLHEASSVRTLLAKVGIDPDDVPAALQAVGLGPDDAVDPACPGRFAELLVHLRPQLLEEARRTRAQLCRYLEQEGLQDGRRWALVDVGWYLNAQAALRRALPEDGADRLAGYYLALRRRRRSLSEGGSFRARVREDTRVDRELLQGGWLLDVPNLVEHVFVRADHGQCVGYEERDGRIVPVLKPAREQPDWYAPMRAAVLRFTEEAAALGLLADGGEAAFAAGDVAGRLFAHQPTREEARLFGGTLVSDDQNEAGLRTLAPPVGLRELSLRLQRGLRLVPDGPQFWRHWYEASWYATPRPTRVLLTTSSAAARAVRGAAADVRAVRARRRGRPAG